MEYDLCRTICSKQNEVKDKMAIHITRLNGGDIIVGSGGGASGHPETRFTLKDGSVVTQDIVGTLDNSFMAEQGWYDEIAMAYDDVVSVDIGTNVTIIGNYTFFNDEYLTSVTIPNTVTSIGENAFGGCTNLPVVVIPDGVTSIGESAF